MKYFFLLFSFLYSVFSFAQNIRIPDSKFKQYLISQGFDANDDGQIQISEALKVKKIYINDLGIVSVEGINSFINLEEFGCYNNRITSLDLSNLTKLKYLYASKNRIEYLNIANSVDLVELSIEGNYFIKELDVSKFKKLQSINFSDNQVSKFDASGLTNLVSVTADNNKLKSINVFNVAGLRSISLRNNPLQPTVYIQGLTQLEFLDFTGCNLLFLNFSGTVSLKKYYW